MENLYPHAVKRISKEIREILKESIDGIKVIVNEQDLTDVQAVIDGPVGTPYDGGKFHIKLAISEKYPREPPKGFFFTKIFHPNVAPLTGEICVNTLKTDWKSDLGVKHVLLVIRCLLVNPNPQSALNEEAGRLFQEDYNEYVSQAQLYTDIHACNHLRDVKPVERLLSEGRSTISAKIHPDVGDSVSILRDANGPSPKKPAVQRHISATKKALKRL
ncbi:Ubiquitin-conjugating enzyme [Paragonimus heterotremus]|uniref:E2 ubiquitin-conjugating enzyme n=1 Tax=Paragonimus heterotremus TaxID=100268 RepID=A0A8J4T7S9_9TREM|nr:Ubiquitin-conjugating enzyme [Paragonimus heterotremus]